MLSVFAIHLYGEKNRLQRFLWNVSTAKTSRLLLHIPSQIATFIYYITDNLISTFKHIVFPFAFSHESCMVASMAEDSSQCPPTHTHTKILYPSLLGYSCYRKVFHYLLYFTIFERTGTLAQRLECSPMARETWVQSQVESYQRL